MDECTCGKIPKWARLVDPECKAIHHDETHGYHTADGEPVVKAQSSMGRPRGITLATLCNNLKTEIERLEGERDGACHHINLQIKRAEKAEAENTRLRELLGDVLIETVDASAYCDGPNIDGDLRAQIRKALEGK